MQLKLLATSYATTWDEYVLLSLAVTAVVRPGWPVKLSRQPVITISQAITTLPTYQPGPCDSNSPCYMARLVDLPWGVLELIAGPLDARGRVFLLATCRRLHQLERAAPGALWQEVTGLVLSDPAQALRCGRWLAARKPYIRRLQLALRFPDASGAHTCQLGTKLAGAALLEALSLQAVGSVEVGPWVCGLPRLQSLVVGSSEGRVALRAALAAAMALVSLRAWGSKGVELEPDCLPPQLEQADLQQPPTTALRVLAGSAHLMRLDLGRCRATLDCSHLGRLASLTHLALSGCHLTTVPPQLSTLTNLVHLNLATNRLEGHGWGHLLPLTRLVSLDLRHQLGNRRLLLPGGLLALCSLRELLLADNPFTHSLPCPPAPSDGPGGPSLPALSTLSLDFEVATRSHAALARLGPSLHHLWLVAASGQVGVAGPSLQDAAAFIRALARMPDGLKVRWWDSVYGRAEFDLADPLQLAGLVLRLAQRYPPLLGMSLGGGQ